MESESPARPPPAMATSNASGSFGVYASAIRVFSAMPVFETSWSVKIFY